MDFFSQGIPLGRWFRITVVIHWTFIIYAAYELMGSHDLPQDILYITLLFGTVLMHEFGHALSCRAVGGEALHIVLWPLGGLAFVQPPNKPWAWLVTTVCGPLVNAVLWPIFWVLYARVLPQMISVGAEPSQLFILVWKICWYMAEINRALLFFNLIPAYPMDGGRMLQEILWIFMGYRRSLQIAGMVGTVCGLGFVVLGVGLRAVNLPLIGRIGEKPDSLLLVIGVMVMIMSFGIYKKSEEIKGWRKN